MNPILQALESGPQTYDSLKVAINGARINLDFALAKLLKARKIVPFGDVVPVRYRLRDPRPTDKPLKPFQPKVKAQKNGERKDKIKRPTCPQCGNRKGWSKFMYGGRLNLYCHDCRDK